MTSNKSAEIPCDIRELSPDLLQDYLNFFDHDAFADNPRWASCYCYFPHAPHALGNWDVNATQQNRAAVSARIRAGQMRGYLAYVDGKVVGWCNAAPRSEMTILDDEPQQEKIGSIVCFVIAKPFRGKRVATRLLQAACDGFRDQGLRVAEAYPRAQAESEASNPRGPLAMYLAAGFERVRESDGSVIVRKALLY